MNARIEQEILSLIEAKAEAVPTPMEFEFAYQARVACDCIRFAIRQTEQTSQSDCAREIAMQLLDALERLESSERRFQSRSRRAPLTTSRIPTGNGIGKGAYDTDGHAAHHK
jgi:hypothetical protein